MIFGSPFPPKMRNGVLRKYDSGFLKNMIQTIQKSLIKG